MCVIIRLRVRVACVKFLGVCVRVTTLAVRQRASLSERERVSQCVSVCVKC